MEEYKWQFEFYDKIMSEAEERKVKTVSGKEVIFKNPAREVHRVRRDYGEEGVLMFELSRLNKYGVPKYHIDDSENPRIIDIYTAYPKCVYGDLKLIYENGYVWVWSPKRGKLFMSMHGYSNNEAKINGILVDLIIRRDTPCTTFDDLD